MDYLRYALPGQGIQFYNSPIGKSDTLKRTNGQLVPSHEYKDVPTVIPADWDVSPGDVLSWAKYRASECYFVLDDGTLLKNPDRSGSGYLTIPFIITQHTRNVMMMYEYVLNELGKDYVSTIEMHPQDKFIVRNYGELPERMCTRNLEYIYDPLEKFLYVHVTGTSGKSKEFKLGETTVKDIEQWYNGIKDEQAQLRVQYNFDGVQYQKYRDYKLQYETIQIPKTWTIQPGITNAGHDHIRGEWILTGDRKHVNDAKKQILEFYKDLVVDIEEIPA
ncbi:unnamed protein product [Didymodactylos carnosus]|uniref:Uncharacterized protein n=1 Tax=Didymodactylos carnosus TaxID=1234261 RepID=A0A814F865_9BILA|nr:unnamed protein product [Didymodactylos carnosus]CAF1076598.1 unnamed protein product [Didymodactylos carnosus]CAF3749235.1 unnamed protein product [Didymodactylos carnosus]CAF3840214.1 unnamed protein product [Didymodactylos carnosus]